MHFKNKRKANNNNELNNFDEMSILSLVVVTLVHTYYF